MAGRIRTIKPEILEHAKTAALSHAAWRAFVSLWLLADDHGNLRADPRQLTGAIFWAAKEVVDWAAVEAELAPHVLFWEAPDGQRYAHIRGWTDHQKVDKPGKPRCPKPSPELLSRDPRETLARPSRDPRETLANGLETPPIHEESSNSRDPRETLARPSRTISDHDHDHDPEGDLARTRAPAPAPIRARRTSEDPPPEITQAVVSELEEGSDLWPKVAPPDLARIARRMILAVQREPTCARDGITPAIAARESVAKARQQHARHPERQPAELLADAEAEATRWIPQQCRKGERRAAPVKATNGQASGDLVPGSDEWMSRALGRPFSGASK